MDGSHALLVVLPVNIRVVLHDLVSPWLGLIDQALLRSNLPPGLWCIKHGYGDPLPLWVRQHPVHWALELSVGHYLLKIHDHEHFEASTFSK